MSSNAFVGVYVCDDDYTNIRPTDDYIAWALWLGTWAKRQVRYDEVGNAQISTVFIGLDYSFGLQVKPLVFETMVIGDGISCDQARIHNATVEGALYAHEAIYMQVIEDLEEI